jgi:hypothetical protein
VSLLHTVLLSFDPELGPEDAEELSAHVRTWPEEIGGFEHLAVGTPISSERAQGYQYLLHIVVPDEEALARYLVHPVHRRFAQWVDDRGGRVLAFDYVLDASTVVHDAAEGTPSAGGGA